MWKLESLEGIRGHVRSAWKSKWLPFILCCHVRLLKDAVHIVTS